MSAAQARAGTGGQSKMGGTPRPASSQGGPLDSVIANLIGPIMVTVVQYPQGFRVVPQIVTAPTGTQIRFVNLTHLVCQIVVPKDSFFGTAGLLEKLESGATSPVLTLSTTRHGAFPYQIYVYHPEGPPSEPFQRYFVSSDAAPHIIIE